ncbi:MAG: oxidoreductase domain-containing protein [Candidatus Saganbacteria bacterium]|uniref:Oxidoreductase domain-containing protein n=1 Tax=Candidatus Saganbacteria bacterium TaxID=2575572 RepID=A0A833L0T3_UNCSA|nr:MAG: oxidoreductase domain-containing protein [Candidatus Saganbacteria bacterium]
MAKPKIGVIGAGIMGENHIRILSGLKDVSFAGFFDAKPERAAIISGKYSCKSFATLEDLLNQISFAVLATPTSTHFELASIILKKGIHLLVEKPLSLSYKKSLLLIDTAKRHKLFLSIGMIERFNPAITKLVSLLKNETVFGFDFKRFSPFPERIFDTSVIFDMMIHDLDLAVMLANSELESFRAQGVKSQSKFIDEANATLYFKNGVIAKIESSRIKNDKLRSLVVTTDKSIYDLNLITKSLVKRSFETLTDKVSIDIVARDQITSEIKDFLLSIAKNKPSISSAASTVYAQKIAEEVENKICSYR